MRARFLLLELILAVLAGFAGALLFVQVLPYEYGTAIDLVAGRRLDCRWLYGITFYAKPHQSILAGYYLRYVGPLPDETQWVIASAGVQRPSVIQRFLPEPPPPRPTAIMDTIHEINQLIARQEAPHAPGAGLLHPARAAVIERTLAVARISGDPNLAFDYVRGVRRQLDDSEGEIGPLALPTAEQYLAMVNAAD